jgi:hypothetical protein
VEGSVVNVLLQYQSPTERRLRRPHPEHGVDGIKHAQTMHHGNLDFKEKVPWFG